MTISIKVPDMNDSVSQVTLANKVYNIRFTWNEYGRYWTFGLYDIDMNPIMHSKKIVPFAPLTHFYTSEIFPDGIIGCMSKLENIGRNDFVNGNADFIFIPNEDLDDWEVADAYE